MAFNNERYHAHLHQKGFFQRHSLSVMAATVVGSLVIAYSVSDPDTHLGSFFGNAIADWSGVLVTVLATKWLFEKGSHASRRPRDSGLSPARKFVRDHSLTIFLVITGLMWVALFARMAVNGKWGQVVGNIVSEWTQITGIVLLTKRFWEPGSKE